MQVGRWFRTYGSDHTGQQVLYLNQAHHLQATLQLKKNRVETIEVVGFASAAHCYRGLVQTVYGMVNCLITTFCLPRYQHFPTSCSTHITGPGSATIRGEHSGLTAGHSGNPNAICNPIYSNAEGPFFASPWLW